MRNSQPALINTRQMTSSRQMRALHRERRKAELEKMRKPLPPKPRPDFVNNEMLMRDEAGYWTVFAGPCPSCGYSGQHRLDRQSVKGFTEFRLRCGLNPGICSYQTEWFEKSKLAIQFWKVASALSK